MELWHSETCPYSAQVRRVLAEKGIAHSERKVAAGEKPPELLALNPTGTVPVLVAGDRVLVDSAKILDFLETEFPTPALLPAAANERDAVREFRERAVTLVGRKLPKVRRGTPEEKAAAEPEIRAALARFESEAPERGFFFGELSLADIVLASFVERLPEGLQPTALALPRLSRWQAEVRRRQPAPNAGASTLLSA